MNQVYLQHTKLMNLPVTRRRDKISVSLNQITKYMKLYLCTVLRSQGFSSVHHFTCAAQSIISLLSTTFPLYPKSVYYLSNYSSRTIHSLVTVQALV